MDPIQYLPIILTLMAFYGIIRGKNRFSKVILTFQALQFLSLFLSAWITVIPFLALLVFVPILISIYAFTSSRHTFIRNLLIAASPWIVSIPTIWSVLHMPGTVLFLGIALIFSVVAQSYVYLRIKLFKDEWLFLSLIYIGTIVNGFLWLNNLT
jgi:hypothetical protein